MKLLVFVAMVCMIATMVVSATRPCKQSAGVTGLCRGYFPSYTYNSTTGQCSRFIYGGCGGSENRFRSDWKCRSACSIERCLETPAVTGYCRANLRKYSFNQETKRCTRFTYGGCGGSVNRFNTRRQCENLCNPCKFQYAVTGRCLAYFERYSYDNQTGRCNKFIYGGCQGSPNSFDTLAACRGNCSRRG